jgi:nucleoside-diphosphate-sugar epimerase
MKVLVTGASGFIGAALCRRLEQDGVHAVTAASRHDSVDRTRTLLIRDLSDLFNSLKDFDAVVHLAARVHQVNDSSPDRLTAFRQINTEATRQLALHASRAGVRRFIYLSSIKVHGEFTVPGRPFVSGDALGPRDPYGISKAEAEAHLALIAKEHGLDVVVVRPPLVYGAGARANFAAMMRALDRGIPLPFGASSNRRSLVALDNLVDLIATVIDHPAAANQTFLVSDGEDLSTAELLRRTARALGRSARLIPVPASLMRQAFKLIGREDLAQRLLGSLQVDISRTRELLSWTPPVRIDDALAQAARAYRSRQARE